RPGLELPGRRRGARGPAQPGDLEVRQGTAVADARPASRPDRRVTGRAIVGDLIHAAGGNCRSCACKRAEQLTIEDLKPVIHCAPTGHVRSVADCSKPSSSASLVELDEAAPASGPPRPVL